MTTTGRRAVAGPVVVVDDGVVVDVVITMVAAEVEGGVEETARSGGAAGPSPHPSKVASGAPVAHRNRRRLVSSITAGYARRLSSTLGRMRFSLMTEPQLGGTYDQLSSLARWAEQKGMVSFARSDHYYSSREPRPDATDAFATLAGLARETTDIRLCVLVSPITFRHPAVIAKTAATIDQMSGGRLDLGVGTGWMDLEHDVFGLPFPARAERFERLSEALPYLQAAFSDGRAGYEGSHYRITADAHPKPTGIRLVVGGQGPVRTPTLAGTHADEYNHLITPAHDLAPKIEVLRNAAEAAGRDPDAIEVTVMGPVLVGRDESEFRARLGKAAAARKTEPDELLRRWTDAGIPVGPPERVKETLAALERAGVSRYYLQWLDLDDRAGLEAAYEVVSS